MKTKDLVLHINEKRDSHQCTYEKEMNVRMQLFGYLMSKIGWDTEKPEHCILEFTEVEGRTSSGTLFDHNDEPIILFETKGIKEDINNHIEQTKEFFSIESSIKVAILTNMVDMYFFSDFETPGVMDETPFYKIHFSTLTDKDVDFFELLRREYFLNHTQEVLEKWRELYFQNRENASG